MVSSDLSLLEPYYPSLHALEYTFVYDPYLDYFNEDHFLIRTLKKCGKNLQKLRCQIGPINHYATNLSDRYKTCIDYYALCDVITSVCTEVQYCISFAMKHFEENYGRAEPCFDSYFYNFEGSIHCKYFGISDFCSVIYSQDCITDEKTGTKYTAEHSHFSSFQILIDFVKLRGLIKDVTHKRQNKK